MNTLKREFKLQFYFNKYKNFPVSNRDNFRMYFRKHEGRYEDINLLIEFIERYQFEKYGETIEAIFLGGIKDERKRNSV